MMRRVALRAAQQAKVVSATPRCFSSAAKPTPNPNAQKNNRRAMWIGAAGLAAVGGAMALNSEPATPEIDLEPIKADIVAIFDEDNYMGPTMVRLAWHSSGSYSKDAKVVGGSDGATIRFKPQLGHGNNAGLYKAVDALEKVKQKHPEISYADLYVLVGAHAIGRCHSDASGYEGPWTNSEWTFANEFFVKLLENKWTLKKWDGPEQYEDETGELMMLPADMALVQNPELKKYVEMYAKDEELWFDDFSKAFVKLTENGVKFPEPQPAWRSWLASLLPTKKE